MTGPRSSSIAGQHAVASYLIDVAHESGDDALVQWLLASAATRS